MAQNTPPTAPLSRYLHTSVRVGQARVQVQIRPTAPLDWAGLLQATVQHGPAIAGFAADALRQGCDQVCLVAQADGVSLDEAPAAGLLDRDNAASREHP